MMIGLPVLAAVIGIALTGVQAGMLQLRLQDQVSTEARYASLGGEVEGATREGDLVCVFAEHTFERGLFALDPLVLSARSCALKGEPSTGVD